MSCTRFKSQNITGHQRRQPDGPGGARGGRAAGGGVLRLLVRGARWHVEGLLHTRPEHADTRGGADRLVVSAEASFGGYRGVAKIDLPVSPCFLHTDRE